MNAKLISDFVTLHDEKQHLEGEAKEIGEKMAKVEEQLLDAMIEDGVQSVKIKQNGRDRLVYINRSMLASRAPDCSPETLNAALVSAGETWGFLVKETVHASSLRSRVSECPVDKDEMPVLPEMLRDKIALFEKFSLRVRRS